VNPDLDLIDIGANLTHKSFRGDLDAVLEAAAGEGVADILITGTSNAVSRRAREMVIEQRARTRPRLAATAGIHPHQASGATPQALAEIRELCARPEVVAVGECGLDYHRDFSPRDAQRRAFEAQLELAAAVRKPVFLHERAAAADFGDILERWRPRLTGAVVHCFTGDRAELERWLALDLHVGFTGWICDERRGTHLRALVGLVPAGRLMIETDAPFILPRDLPGRSGSGRNEPRHLSHIAAAVARYRGEALAELARHTTATARALFGLGTADPGRSVDR
jgi:TatD DNase family protein